MIWNIMQSLLKKSIIKKYIIEIGILIILEYCVRTLVEILIVGTFSHTVYFSLKSVGDFWHIFICGPIYKCWEKLEPS